MFKKIDELVEENAKLKEALARVEAERDWWKEQRDILADYCRRADERARTAQPASGEPIAYVSAATIAKLKLGKSAPATLFAPPIPEEHHGVALYTAPPAAAPVAAGEPAAWECVHKGYLSLSYEKEGDPERAVPLFRAAPPAAAHGGEIESLAVNRYRPTPDGLLHYKVVAGDGRRSLFTGTKAQCYLVAAKLTEAFLDGAYVQNSAAHEDEPK